MPRVPIKRLAVEHIKIGYKETDYWLIADNTSETIHKATSTETYPLSQFCFGE